jgi:hypothetical protein
MRRVWKDEDITKILKKMDKTPVDRSVYDRVWFKVEERIERRNRSFLNNIVWRPWIHPIRWVAAAACLVVTFTSVLYHQNALDQADLASYVETVSNPTANVTNDIGIVHVSSLISGAPSSPLQEALFFDESSDSLSNDELAL